MSDLEKKTTGAPSSDTTSALFVSARKKQLEQQEEERIAREKEEKRMAAEIEVRRLEKEVEERRKRAEEEAVRVEEEAKRKPIDPAPRDPAAKEGGPLDALKKLPKETLAIIGGGLVVLIAAIVLIIALSGGSKIAIETVSFADIDAMDAKGLEAMAKDIVSYAQKKGYAGEKPDIAALEKSALAMLDYKKALTLNENNPMRHMSSGPLWYVLMGVCGQDSFETEWVKFAPHNELKLEETVKLPLAFLNDPTNTPDDIVAAFITMDDFLWREQLITKNSEALFFQVHSLLENIPAAMANIPDQPGMLFAIFASLNGLGDEVILELTGINMGADDAAEVSGTQQSAAQETPAPKASDLLNATDTLKEYNMSFKYPSASFYVFQNEGNSVMLSTRQEDLGAISIIMSENSVTGKSSQDKIDLFDQIGSGALDYVLSSNKDGVAIISNVQTNDNNVLEYIGEGIYTDENDVSCKIFVRVASRSETGTIYILTVMARSSSFDICKTLALRIKDSISFNS